MEKQANDWGDCHEEFLAVLKTTMSFNKMKQFKTHQSLHILHHENIRDANISPQKAPDLKL